MIVSIGEVVWDVFPDRQVLGGAPINVAYHLQALGREVQIITRVGNDALGKKTLARLAELGLATEGVQRDAELPTGQVRITLGGDQEPRFEILAPAAWDRIDAAEALRLVGPASFSLVFGTLAQRDPHSREAIHLLRQRAETRFYDVNLRPPFTTRELVAESMIHADLVKMNHEELDQVAGWLGCAGPDQKKVADALCSRYDLAALAVTEGGQGAWLVAGGEIYRDAAEPVEVMDTVGAGDAFFAALIDGFLAGRPWPEVLRRANRRGGYVASRRGATPPMPADL